MVTKGRGSAVRDKVNADTRARRVMAINVDMETFMGDDAIFDNDG